MLKSNFKEVTIHELLDHLRDVEINDIQVNPHGSNPWGFDLYFVPVTTFAAHISNIDDISKWAAAHWYSISVGYDTEMEAITLRLVRMLPLSHYSDDEII